MATTSDIKNGSVIMHKNKRIIGLIWHPERAPNKESKLILKTVFCDKDFWK